MTLRTIQCGLISLFLTVVCGLSVGGALAQQAPPTEGVDKPRPDAPPTTQPEQHPESQRALEKLRQLREAGQQDKQPPEPAAGPETAPIGSPNGTPPPPAIPTEGPRTRPSFGELRAKAQASTQRAATEPTTGAAAATEVPGDDVPADFVGPPVRLGRVGGPSREPQPSAAAPSEAGAPGIGEETSPPTAGRRSNGEESENWFNFNGMPWEAVIEDFVRRIGKPLMTDTALDIGGQLTYITDRKFTKEEAIDELNLIMQEKGYRFVEREYHIYIVPLAEMPRKVDLKYTFNSFEAFQQANPRDMDYVTVYYQVKDQPAKLYVDMFSGALPDYAMVSSLEESNQIKIVALARDVRKFMILKDLIQITPSDPRPIRVFDIKTNAREIEQLVRNFLNLGGGAQQVQMVPDPRTGRMMAQRVPGAGGGGGEKEIQMIADDRTNSIIVKATDDKIKEIEQLIVQFDQKPDIGEFKTKVILINHADARDVAELLRDILSQEQGQARAPNWQLQQQMRMQQLQQQRGRRGMVQPQQPQQPQQPVQMQPGAAPEDIIWEGAYERAKKTIRLVPDARTNSLIVYANDEGFKRVDEMLEIIDKALPDTYQVFVLEHAKVADVTPLVTQIVQGMTQAASRGGRQPTIVPDEAANAFHVIAEREDMEKIEKLITELDTTAVDQERHMVELKNLRPSDVAQMVQTLLGSGGGAAVRRATPPNVRGRAPMPPAPSATPGNTYQVIALDEAQLLIVVCSDDDWVKVEETIRMWDERAMTSTPQLETFVIQKGNPQTIAATLSSFYGRYTHPVLGPSPVSIQADGDRILVYGVRPAIEEISVLLDTLDVESPSDVEVLALINADATTVAQQLQTLFGGARPGPRGTPVGGGPVIQAEPVTNSLIVQADKTDMEKIKSFAMEMDQKVGTQLPEQKFFTLVSARPQDVVQAVMTIFGPGGGRGPRTPTGVQVKAMAAGAQVIIEGPKEKMAEIEAFIKKIDDPKGREIVVKTVKLPRCDVTQIAQNLTTTIRSIPRPDGVQSAFLADPATESIIISAPADMYPKIDELIATLTVGSEDLLPVTLALKYADPNQVAQMIQAMFRRGDGRGQQQDLQVSVSNGMLVVKASKDKLKEIQDLVAAVDAPDPSGVQVKTYDLKVLNATMLQVAVQGFLGQMKKNVKAGGLAPGAYAEPTTNTLVVLAPPEAMVFIDRLVAEMEGKAPKQSEAHSYVLQNVRADQIATNVDAMLKAKVIDREGVKKTSIQTAVFPMADSNRLFVFAPEEYQTLAGELIRMIDEETTTGEIVHIIPLDDGDAQQMAASLNTIVQGRGKGGVANVRIAADVGSNTVLLSGLPKDVADAEKWITELDGNSVRVPELQTFQLQYATAAEVESAIKNLFGQGRNAQEAVTVTADEYSGRLIVTANRRTMRRVEGIIEKLDQKPEAEAGGLLAGGRDLYFVDIARGSASDIAWDARDLLPDKEHGGPTVEADWFGEYIRVTCRPSEFPKIEKLIREFERRAKVETVVKTRVLKGDPQRVLAYLAARRDDVEIEQPQVERKVETLVEDLWQEGEEPASVTDRRERAEREKANGEKSQVLPFKPGLSLSEFLLDDIEAELYGQPKPAPAARSATLTPVRAPAAPVTTAGPRLFVPAVYSAGTGSEDVQPTTAPKPADVSLPSASADQPAGTTGQTVASPLKKEKTHIICQPDGTIVMQGPKEGVSDIGDVLDLLEEDLGKGEVVRIFRFKYGDVSAAAEILTMMFDVQQRQVVIQQPQPQQQRGQQGRGGQAGQEGQEGRDQQGGLMDQLRSTVGGKQATGKAGGVSQMRVATDPGHNYLIVKCQETALPEIRRLLRELDIPPGEVQVKIIQLKTLVAEETAENIKDVLGISKVQQRRGGRTPTPAGGRPGQGGQQQQLIEMLQQQMFSVPGVEGGAKVERVEIVANPTTNSLMVSAPPEVMALIEKVIGDLEDLEGRDVTGYYRYPLTQAHVDDVLPLLREIFDATGGGGSAARPGRAPRAGAAGSGGGGSPSAMGPVTVWADPRVNTIIYAAQAKDVEIVENQIRMLDIKGAVAEMDLYVCQYGDAETIASVLEPIFASGGGKSRGPAVPGANSAATGGTGDVQIIAEAATNTILVWGPPARRALILKKIADLDKLNEEMRTIETVQVHNVPPSQVVSFIYQFIEQRPVATSGSQRGGAGGRRQPTESAGPQIVPNDSDKTLIVRGTKRQIEEVRELVERFDSPDFKGSTFKVVAVPLGQDATRLAQEVERLINDSEEQRYQNTGQMPRRVTIAADEFTNALIIGGDPSSFGLAEGIIEQLSQVRTPQFVTRVIQLKKLSAPDAEKMIDEFQQRKGGSSRGSSRGSGAARPSNSGGSGPAARPPSSGGTPRRPSATPRPSSPAPAPTPRPTPAPSPPRPSGGGAKSAPDSGASQGSAGVSPAIAHRLNDPVLMVMPAAWVEPIIATTPISSVLGLLLADELPGSDREDSTDVPKAKPQAEPTTKPATKPAGEVAGKPPTKPTSQPATKAAPKETTKPASKPVTRPATKPAEEPIRKPEERARPSTRQALLHEVEQEMAGGPLTAEGEPELPGLSGVSGSLRGEVSARALDSQQLIITGDASDVEFIEQVLALMEQSASPPVIEVFPLQISKATALAPIIEKAIKAQIDAQGTQDKFSINAEARSNSLIVAASDTIMGRIAELVEKLDVEKTGGGGPPDFKTVLLEHIRASEAVAIMRPTIEKLNAIREVPKESQASIDADDRTNSVLIIGTPQDIAEIERLANTIDIEISAGAEKKSFVAADVILIQLKNGSADDIAKVLTDMIKAEQEAATQGGGGQQKTAGKPFVKKLRLRLADGRELPELDLERPIRVLAEKGTNSLIIFSTKENNEALTAIVEVFDTLPVGSDTDVKAFALRHAGAEEVAKLLTDIFKDKSYLSRPSEGDSKGLQKGVLPPVPPGVAAKGLPYPIVVQHDTRSNTVVVIGRTDAVLLAAGLISELDRPTMELGVKAFVLQLKSAQATQLAEKLKKLMDDRAKALGADKNAARDNAVIQPDERSNRLIVLATQEVYDMVEDLVLELDAADKYSVVDMRYRALKFGDAIKLQGLLEETFKARQDAETKLNKDAKDTLSVVADARSNSLLLTGTRDYLEVAEALITELDREFDGTVMFKGFKVRLNSAANIASLLTDMIDKALKQADSKLKGTPIHVSADPVSDTLLVAAAREDMTVLQRWIEILDRPSEVGRMTRIIPLERGVAEDVSKAVGDIFKKQAGGAGKGGGEIDVTVSADKTTNSVVAFGPPALLADIEDFVRQLDSIEARKNAIVRIFKLEQANAQDIGDLLSRILELRGGSVGGTGGGGSSGGSGKQDAAKQVMLVFQQLHPEVGMETLKAMRADVVVISDLRTNSLVVTAPPDSMALMESLIAAVDVPPDAAKIRVFRLRNGDAEQMVKMLGELFQQKTATGTGRTGGGATGEPERVLTLAEGEGGGREEIAFTTDVRTNSVIAAGTRGYLDLVENMILDLDTVPIKDRETFVYAPKNITAKTLQASIKEFSDAEKSRLEEVGKEVSTAVKQERKIVAIANEDANRLLLDVDPRFKDTVMKVVGDLDQPPPQVIIQVLILEVTMDNDLDLGVEFAFQDLQYAKAGPKDTTTFDYVGGTDIGAAGSGLGGFTFTITGADFNFLFRTLQSEGNLNVLSRPQIVAMDNKEAKIDVSDDVPYVTGTQTSSTGQIATSVGRKPVGIVLTVTPQINPDGFVRMKIAQEVSDVTGSTVDVGPGVTAPIFFNRKAETNLTVMDNETVVLGGLITSRTENREQKIPLVGDIPGLGLLFRNQSDTTRRKELLLVLTPHVARTPDEYRDLSIVERDRLRLISDKALHDPLMQGLRLQPEEQRPIDGGLAPSPLEPAQQEIFQPKEEEYGPLRPALRAEPPGRPGDPNSYDVPVSWMNRQRR